MQILQQAWSSSALNTEHGYVTTDRPLRAKPNVSSCHRQERGPPMLFWHTIKASLWPSWGLLAARFHRLASTFRSKDLQLSPTDSSRQEYSELSNCSNRQTNIHVKDCRVCGRALAQDRRMNALRRTSSFPEDQHWVADQISVKSECGVAKDSDQVVPRELE